MSDMKYIACHRPSSYGLAQAVQTKKPPDSKNFRQR